MNIRYRTFIAEEFHCFWLRECYENFWILLTWHSIFKKHVRVVQVDGSQNSLGREMFERLNFSDSDGVGADCELWKLRVMRYSIRSPYRVLRMNRHFEYKFRMQ